jgi:glycerophosphoryl diester phosphodiesterase
VAARLGKVVRSEAAALQLPRQSRGVQVVNRQLVDAAHSAGLQVHVWTVNDPNEMEELLDLGVDAVITDRPDLLKDVLSSRGTWAG